jgi:transposase-like protein
MSVPPSEKRAKELLDLVNGTSEKSGEILLSDIVRKSVEKTVQELLEAEQAEHLGRQRYQRYEDITKQVDNKKLHRNGYMPRKLRTAEGVLSVEVPQIRGGDTPYRSELISRFANRSEALENLVVEMYVHGLSVRDIEAALGKATGSFILSDSTVSVISERLYEDYEHFRKRRLDGFDVAYVFIDAVYEPLKRYGVKTAVLCTWGTCVDGSKVLLDLRTGNSESYEATLELLRDLISRGLCTPLTITTDGAPGVTKAIDAIWPKSKRIRCWFHKMRNLQQKCPPENWPTLKPQILDCRDAPSFDEGKERLDRFIERHEPTFPELCRCLQKDKIASLNHLYLPHRHQQTIRTTNTVERSFVEERRRTKVTGHLWDEKSLVKLVFAVLIRVSERWSKRQFSEFEERQLQKLRQDWGLIKEDENVTIPKPKRLRRTAGAVSA